MIQGIVINSVSVTVEEIESRKNAILQIMKEGRKGWFGSKVTLSALDCLASIGGIKIDGLTVTGYNNESGSAGFGTIAPGEECKDIETNK